MVTESPHQEFSTKIEVENNHEIPMADCYNEKMVPSLDLKFVDNLNPRFS